jgi:NitT/TauT family transport system permease protein
MNIKKSLVTNKLLLLPVLFVLWNSIFMLTGLFKAVWIGILLVDFIIIAFFFQQLSLLVSPRCMSLFEKLIAAGFSIVLLGSWELLVRWGVLNGEWFPPPSKIMVALWNLSIHYDKFSKTSLLGRFWLIPAVLFEGGGWEGVKALLLESHLNATILRIIGGFVLGAIPGLIIGVFMGMSRIVRIMLDPVVSAIYVVPKITILPLMMLIFSPYGETYKIVSVGIGVFFMVLINTMTGVKDIDPLFLEAGENYGANRLQMFLHVIIPGALPFIFAGLRLGLGMGLVVVIAIEFLRAQQGVGYITWYYWEVMIVENMYAGLVIIMVLGVLCTYGLQRMERWIIPWQRQEQPMSEVKEL